MFLFPFLGSWVGWVGCGNGAGLPLGSLHVSFRGFWIGRMGGPRQRGWAPIGRLWPNIAQKDPEYDLRHIPPYIVPTCFFSPLWAPGSDGWAAATGLGCHWAPFMFPFWASRFQVGWGGRGNRLCVYSLLFYTTPFSCTLWNCAAYF